MSEALCLKHACTVEQVGGVNADGISTRSQLGPRRGGGSTIPTERPLNARRGVPVYREPAPARKGQGENPIRLHTANGLHRPR